MASPNTIRVYDLDGSVDFPVAFDYLARRFVVVTLLGVDRKELVQGSDYTFLTDNMIRLSGTLDTTGYGTIEVKRVTSTEERLVVFNDASILTASDLNLSDLQVVHIAEEGRDIASDSLGSDDDGNLDARGRRLVNLADPVNDQDAVTKHYYDTQVDGVGQNAQAAAASAAAALASQTAAAASQAAAAGSASAASTSATAALSSENKAKDWAIKTDAPVEGTERSSKWHAQQAATSASAAAGSASAAAASQAAAAGSATAAASSASAAAASAASINPDLLVHQDSATGGAFIPSGTTAQRPSVGSSDHPVRYNTTLKQFEGAGEGGVWGGIGGGALGGGTDKVFYPSDTEVTQDFTLAANKNWMVPGALKVSAKLTIEGRLVIV
jgi:hypothetical protein